MKAGILTFHMAHNYGAMLQAYALRKKINQLGVECEVIDYRLPEIYNWHRKDRLKKLVKDNGYIVGTMKYCKRIATRYYTKDKRWCGFNEFMETYIGISSKTYESTSELKELNYDIYICGSDQIWNKEHSGGTDKGYFLDFTDKDVKRIAYAASKGPTEIDEDDKDVFLSKLKAFDAIGVREKGLQESLKEIGIKGSEWVLDPTLLLNKNEWLEIQKERNIEKYVLIYKVKNDKRLYDCARKYASKNNCKIVEITYHKDESLEDIIQIEDCGPRDFLNIFNNADFVVTNSFHGTCFSVNFNKQFYAIPYKGLSSRIDSILELLKLENRNIENIKDIEFEEIDYTNANLILEDERRKSIEFLQKSLSLN